MCVCVCVCVCVVVVVCGWIGIESTGQWSNGLGSLNPKCHYEYQEMRGLDQPLNMLVNFGFVIGLVIYLPLNAVTTIPKTTLRLRLVQICDF